MLQPRYERFKSEQPILRDYLALDRTILANERTVLSYARTALGLVVLGVSAIKFFGGTIEVVAGSAFIVLGVLVGVFGGYRFLAVQGRIGRAIAQSEGARGESGASEGPGGA